MPEDYKLSKETHEIILGIEIKNNTLIEFFC